jgi:pimeloyl-ACP methyl ester carboxylesterase
VRALPLSDGSLLRFHDLAGHGPALLFVHGLGCAGSCDYPAVARAPALAGRRVLLVDLLGFGLSDHPSDFGYAVADHARVLAELLDALAPELGGPVDLYGHSLGGSIAIELAAARPDRIGRLVVSEPNLRAGGGAFSRPIAAQAERDYLATGHLAAVAAERAAGNHLWGGSLAISSPLAVHRAAASLVRGAEPSWLDVLLGLSLPRAAVWGARSMPDPDADLLAAAGLPLRLVPDAGHSMAHDNPAGLAAALAAAVA